MLVVVVAFFMDTFYVLFVCSFYPYEIFLFIPSFLFAIQKRENLMHFLADARDIESSNIEIFQYFLAWNAKMFCIFD